MGGARCLREMSEFGTFSEREQRYIRSSLENAWGEDNDPSIFEHWGKGDPKKESQIKKQHRIYDSYLPAIIESMPAKSTDYSSEFMGDLIEISIFDLSQGYIESFRSYRFLYERLLTVKIRPWLPSSFVCAGAFPSLEPDLREKLLQSLPGNAAKTTGWSATEVTFHPTWVNKIGVRLS